MFQDIFYHFCAIPVAQVCHCTGEEKAVSSSLLLHGVVQAEVRADANVGVRAVTSSPRRSSGLAADCRVVVRDIVNTARWSIFTAASPSHVFIFRPPRPLTLFFPRSCPEEMRRSGPSVFHAPAEMKP